MLVSIIFCPSGVLKKYLDSFLKLLFLVSDPEMNMALARVSNIKNKSQITGPGLHSQCLNTGTHILRTVRCSQ